MVYNGIFLLQWWSVRVYFLLMKKGLDIRTSKDAIELGDAVRDGKYRNWGYRNAIELYRGAGLGIYPIYKRINTRLHKENTFHLELERVRELCMQFDKQFHAIN